MFWFIAEIGLDHQFGLVSIISTFSFHMMRYIRAIHSRIIYLLPSPVLHGSTAHRFFFSNTRAAFHCIKTKKKLVQYSVTTQKERTPHEQSRLHRTSLSGGSPGSFAICRCYPCSVATSHLKRTARKERSHGRVIAVTPSYGRSSWWIQ